MQMIGPIKGVWKGPYMAEVVGSTETEAGSNRWRYDVTAARYAGGTNFTFEQVPGTGEWEGAMNLAESINTSTSVEGQPLNGDSIVPIADGMVVFLWVNGSTAFFSMPNQWVCE